MDRFSKLVEKHKQQADPQNINQIIQDQRVIQTTKEQKKGEEIISKLFTDVKQMYFKDSESEVKIQQVAEKIILISDQQKEIINNLQQAGGQDEFLKKMTNEIQEKLRYTMFMI